MGGYYEGSALTNFKTGIYLRRLTGEYLEATAGVPYFSILNTVRQTPYLPEGARRLRLDNLLAHRVANQLRDRMHAQASHHISAMGVDRFESDSEQTRDLFVRSAFGE